MSRHHDPSLRPRNGHTLVVGVVARISGGPNQKDLSLDDQVDHAKDVVAELYDGPVEYRVISTKAKGERLDRPELEQIEAMLRSRELDLMIADDIGRMVRGTEAVRLCGIAVDHATRVIAPNDCIDTAEESWEEDVISACRDHVGHNAHTSKRLKQKLMNRFKKFGGATPREIYGYLKPEGSRTYDDWQKVAEATAIYPEWFLRLRADRNCSAVADWLNEKEVPPGKYCRRKKWDGAMVRRVTANTLLKGKPGRGHTRTVKHHETGRRVAVKNPQGAHYLEYPHLAHVEEDLFDEVNALLEGSNRGLGRPRVDGVDPRQGVPRKRTRFPGQHACCWYCGREYVWGATA
jgi:site-specific DNA recombinase